LDLQSTYKHRLRQDCVSENTVFTYFVRRADFHIQVKVLKEGAHFYFILLQAKALLASVGTFAGFVEVLLEVIVISILIFLLEVSKRGCSRRASKVVFGHGL